MLGHHITWSISAFPLGVKALLTLGIINCSGIVHRVCALFDFRYRSYSVSLSYSIELIYIRGSLDLPPINQHPASLAISLKALIVSPSPSPPFPSLPTSGTGSEYSLNLGTAYGEFQISGRTIKSGLGVDLEAARTAARATLMLFFLFPVKEASWRRASRKGLALISIVYNVCR